MTRAVKSLIIQATTLCVVMHTSTAIEIHYEKSK